MFKDQSGCVKSEDKKEVLTNERVSFIKLHSNPLHGYSFNNKREFERINKVMAGNKYLLISTQ